MGVDGVATLDASNTPAPPRAGEQVDLQSYVKFLAPVVAVAGSARQSTFYTGFSNTVVDSSGATLEVTAVPGTGGKPISAIVARRNGVPVSRLTLTWVPEAGGFLLAKQTAALYRGPSAELFAVMTVDIRYQSIDPQGLAARMARELLRYAVGLVLPQPLHAQSGCGARVLATVSGFVGLLASAPTVATGIGAIGWLAGWGMWTSGLMGMADACDKK